MTAEELRTLEQLKERYALVERLRASDGWKLFDQAFAFMEAQSYELLVGTANPHEAAKHLGAYHAIRNARTWPRRELEALLTQVNMMNDAAAAKIR